MSLYEELKTSGAEMENHYSDLYVRCSPVVLAILEKHNLCFSHFFSGGELWIDVPLAFDPYWEARA